MTSPLAYPDWAVGDLVTADRLDDALPKIYIKAGSTSRNTTTTLAADTDLQGIALAVGTYEVELVLFYTVASTTPRLKTRWGFTGTISDTVRLCHGPGSAQVANPQDVTEATARGYGLTSQDAVYNSSTSGAYSCVLEKAAGVQVTVAGNFSLDWAQVTSNGSNVTIQAGTYFRIKRIA